jgi:tRNA-2-methylthio-N6-dimethylallyladenosine synthase
MDLVRSIRKSIPDIALSTDVIVGFPGESEEQFYRTLDIIREVRFDVIHMAAYSTRPETFAARHFTDDVPDEVKKARLKKVESINEKIAGEINSKILGKTVEVLVEGTNDGKWYGRTRGDKLVFFESVDMCSGKLVKVEITKTSPWALQGNISRENHNGQ